MNNKRIVGVIVARFQVQDLHEGHHHLIKEVMKRHEDVLILLGIRVGVPTAKDPLDFPTRARMIQKTYPGVRVRPLSDQPTNKVWSEELDKIIMDEFPRITAKLYGSRQSFIPHYGGMHETVLLEKIAAVSGTEIREKASKKILSSSAFRRGMIYSAQNRFPISFQAVDMAILDKENEKILLGKRNRDEGKLRFFGGFVDPTDGSLEEAALRESREEAGDIGLDVPYYLGSFRINDHRYRNSLDQVMTALFVSHHVSGDPKGGDDVDAVEWIEVKDIMDKIVPEHTELAKKLFTHLAL